MIGTIFALNTGNITEPIAGLGATFVVRVDNMAKTSENTDYTNIISKLRTTFKQKVEQDAPYRALEEALDVQDNRLMFY